MIGFRWYDFFMNLLNREFNPSIFISLVTLIAVLLFISLGIWQLERATHKRDIVNRFEARLQAEFKEFAEIVSLDDMQYRKVILRGRYDDRHTMLVDNQLNNGQAGFHVVTPFNLDDGRVVLVNRGWVALGESRQVKPEIAPQDTVTTVRGTLVSPPEGGFRLGEITISDSWPMLIPFIDIDRLQPIFSNRLLPVLMWLSPQQEDAYVRDWQPVWLSPEKSEAYALQWFSFAVIAIILFVILNLRKLDERRSNH